MLFILPGCGLNNSVHTYKDYEAADQEDGPPIALFRYDLDSVTLKIVSDAEHPKRVSEWADDIDDELLVANGVFFKEDWSPAGLLVSNGDIVSPQLFDRKRSGLLIFAPEFRIIDTATQDMPAPNDLVEAAQSYPFLVKDGIPVVPEDSGLTARRTFVGTDTDGNIYFGIVDRNAMSLFELSLALAAMDIEWDDVLNLDGGPSSGIITAGLKDRDFDSQVPVPNVIILSPKYHNL
jgi:uncharacterized protein YigE (DUF2233 family)